MLFEWDDQKAGANLTKHGVSFDEGETVFADPLAGIGQDPDHSDEEDREIITGYSDQHRLLLVSFTQRGESIRIVSAREATRSERKLYEEKKSGREGR